MIPFTLAETALALATLGEDSTTPLATRPGGDISRESNQEGDLESSLLWPGKTTISLDDVLPQGKIGLEWSRNFMVTMATERRVLNSRFHHSFSSVMKLRLNLTFPFLKASEA